MANEYVLVSQGIEIYRTTDKGGAGKMMNDANVEWLKYCQECSDSGERHADNEVFMYEEMRLKAKCEIGFLQDEVTEVIAYIHTGDETTAFLTDDGMKFEFLGKQYSLCDFQDKFEVIN